MMDMGITFSEIAEMNESATFNTDFEIKSVSTDTRRITEGDTFVAIHGERFDGHDFIEDAISRGASSVVTARNFDSDVPCMVVKDTLEALGTMASVFRRKFKGKVVGITGSNGKTTVKEMLKNIFEQSMAVSATVANNNNKIGVPLTILSARTDDDVWLVEMGTSEKGEIPYLADLVHPDVSVITNISESHLAGFGSKEDVFLEKSAIVAGMSDGGTAVLNVSSPWYGKTKEMFSSVNLVSFGIEKDADVSCDFTSHIEGYSVEASMGNRRIGYTLRVPGEHNVINSLAAIGVSVTVGASDEDIAKGLETYRGIKGRMEVRVLRNGVTLINDSYNASPASVKAALKSLGQYAGRRIFVFGGMAELGEQSDGLHAEVAMEASHAAIDSMYVLGVCAMPTFDRFEGDKYHTDDMQNLLDKLSKDLLPKDVVLIKGSRMFHMERVVDFLEGEAK